MEIGFDMQALQSVNSIGGIGKYNSNFLKCLFELYPDNKYVLFFNRLYRDSSFKINEQKNVRIHTINYLPGNDLNPINRVIQYTQYRLKSLDLLHILSPFEDISNAVIPSQRFPRKTIITIYDFIPFIFRDLYLTSAIAAKSYHKRLAILKSASLILAISESTRSDAINLFHIAPEKIINIGLAASPEFYKIDAHDSDLITAVQRKYGIKNSFILTVSNLDHRKNLAGVLRAFSCLPDALLKNFSLIVVCNSQVEYVNKNEEINQIINQNKNARIKFLYFTPASDLNILYNICHLFIYASLYEGGGLPVLEAMQCGAPVIASNTSSIPELIGRVDTLFNPKDIDDIAHSMMKSLTNDTYRLEIGRYGHEHSKDFSWENVVKKAVKAYEHALTI